MTINCLIIDDEPLSRKGLKEYIAEIDFLNLLGEFDNALLPPAYWAAGKCICFFSTLKCQRSPVLIFSDRLQTRLQ